MLDLGTVEVNSQIRTTKPSHCDSPNVDYSRIKYFRISYAVVGLIYACNQIALNHLRWYGHPYSWNFIHFLNVSWLFLLLLLLLGLKGWTGRAVTWAHYIVALSVLDSIPPALGACVQETLYLVTAFWICFMDLSGSKKQSDWPLFLLGINVTLLVTSSGFCKLVDPLWRNGLGFYYSFLMPWIKPASLDFLLDSRSLMFFMNYATMLLELLTLPLFYFKATRRYSIISLAILFSGFIFPFRLDFIGWIGLVIALGLLTIIKSNIYRQSSRAINWLGNTTVALMFLFYLMPLLNYLDASFHDAFLYRVINNATLKATNDRIAHGLVWRLFTKEHTVGIYEYRVVATLADGKISEPYPVFAPDMTGGPFTLGIVPRAPQALMFTVTDAANRYSYREDYVLGPTEEQRLKGLIELTRFKIGRPVRQIVIKIRPILVPDRFEGNVRYWESTSWEDFYLFDEKQNTFFLGKQPAILKHQGRLPELPNYSS